MEPPDPALRPAVPPEACLDFVNTLSWRGGSHPTEHLCGPDDLLAWARQQGVATHEAASLPSGQSGAALFEAGIALRELLHRVFAARASGQAVAAADLASLNAALAAAPSRTALAEAGGAYAWRTTASASGHPAGVEALLAPVLWSAADLLAQGGGERPGARLRACANPECRWLFIDASRNGSRRWCDMAACGNRAKAQRHYLRAKAART